MHGWFWRWGSRRSKSETVPFSIHSLNIENFAGPFYETEGFVQFSKRRNKGMQDIIIGLERNPEEVKWAFKGTLSP